MASNGWATFALGALITCLAATTLSVDAAESEVETARGASGRAAAELERADADLADARQALDALVGSDA